MSKHLLTVYFTNDFLAKNQKLNAVLQYLSRECPYLTEDDLFDLHTVYNELITNVIIYGEKGRERKAAELRVYIDNSWLAPYESESESAFELISAIRNDAIMDIFPEGERALQIVFGFADYVEWKEMGKELVFRKRFGRVGAKVG